MAKVEFIYEGKKNEIQCKEDDKIGDIINKYLNKIGKKKEDIYFLYSGQKLDENLAFNETLNNLDKDKKTMIVQAIDSIVNEEENSSCLKKSEYVICPDCFEKAYLSIDDKFIISISDCKNGHKKENIPFEKFEKTQFIDETKILCGNCKTENKSNTFKNSFYICCNCHINLCPLCKNTHEKSHFIINYEDKDFYCQEHCEMNIYFCNDCKKDICSRCENQHNSHKTTSYGSIMPNEEELKDRILNLKERINDVKKDIKDIISKLERLTEYLDKYFKINNDIINNFDIKKKNYSIMQNIIFLNKYNTNFILKINNIINNNNIRIKFNNLMEFYNKMVLEDISKIEEKKEEIENKVKKYNPSDDKYENFNIKNIKELQSFEVQCNNPLFFICLNDRRILLVDENKKEDIYKYRIYVYDLNNNNRCDINYILEDTNKVVNLFQMDDDNLILSIDVEKNHLIKVLKIRRKSIEEIFCIEAICFDKIYKLFNDRIITYWNSGERQQFEEYWYKEGKLRRYYFFDLNEDMNRLSRIADICGLNEGGFVIYYYTEGKLFGHNAYLQFYDYYSIDMKKLKLGDRDHREFESHMLLIDQNNLIVELNKKFLLIDTKNAIIKNEFKFKFRNPSYALHDFIPLNDKTFLFLFFGEIIQFEFQNSKINLIEERDVLDIEYHKNKKNDEMYGFVEKYPDNKLVVYYGTKIIIYG